MRHWQLLNRLLRVRDPRAEDRCVLVVEQLEGRENPAPIVFGPSFTPQTSEDAPLAFGGEGGSFSTFDSNNSGQTYTATLTSTNGTITVDEARAVAVFGLTVANNGTVAVTVTGPIDVINSFLQTSQFEYDPAAFYSGEASVGLLVTDTTNGDNGSGSVLVKVTPVVSPASLSVNASEEVWALSGGFAFPPGFVSVSSWPDADGSERATISFSLSAEDPEGFALFAGGVELTALEPGFWQVSATSQAALQSILDSLTLVPPSGFTGRVGLFVFGNLSDSAGYPSDMTAALDSTDLGFGFADLRFFLGTNVALQPVSAPEGGTIDLGGRFVATDPDELPGDTHTLTLSVPGGLFTFSEAALVEGMSAVREVAPDGRTTITLSGNLDAINAFLAAPGSLLYSAPAPDFSGTVPLTVTLANRPGEEPEGSVDEEGSQLLGFAPLVTQEPGEAPGKFGGVVTMFFAPAADHVFPSADNAVTNQDTPVAVTINVAPLPTDPSESLLIVLGGVPAGASFNNGTNLGGGMWALSTADLSGLMFTPPPGASGVYAMSVKAIVTDSDPDTGISDSATESTMFAITVIPVVPVVPNILVLLPIDFGDLQGDFSEPIVSGEFGDLVSADPDGTEDRPGDRDQESVVLPEAFAGATPGDQGSGSTEDRVGLSAPGPGSLFAQPETPLPTYGGGEKHPLPPVLPLDQSSPVAGFTESGGDSFALIDKLYRDAAAAQGANPNPDEAVTVAGARTEGDAVPVPVAPPAPEQTVAVVAPDPGAGALPSLADVSESQERVWVAGATVASALAAWAWLSRNPNGRLARAVRRFLHPARRPIPTEAC